MMHPRSINIQVYDYILPEDRVARFPLNKREQSRLLIYKNGAITDSFYKDLDHHIPENSLVVLNNTKVVEARILFKKSTGANIEIFCLEPYNRAEVHNAMEQKGTVKWRCLIGGASKWKRGQILTKEIKNNDTTLSLRASFVSKEEDHFVIEFKWSPGDFSFAEVLHIVGEVPLPPYLQREPQHIDKDRYQTVYAQETGSVASPTAGLHFTMELINRLTEKNIAIKEITLHVGAGTFLPVKSTLLENHFMHAEWIRVSKPLIEELIRKLKTRVVAIGTTSLRTLESLYWIGLKIFRNQDLNEEALAVGQWEPYDEPEELEPEAALTCLVRWLEKNERNELVTQTRVLIAPGYRFRIVDILITNFHQPRSTLLLLIAAFIGENWKQVYKYALDREYRFLSYGDGSLLFRNDRLF